MTRVGYFDRPEHAQRFDRLTLHPRLLAALGELLALRGTEQVLDVGTGTGRVAACLLPMLPAGCIIGVDAAAAMLRQARSKQSAASRYRLVCGVAERLPIHGAAVDVALFACALHHFEDPSAAFCAAHRVLKADGRLVVLGPVVAEPVDELDLAVQRAVEGVFRHSHGPEFRFLTTRQAARLVEDAGFAIYAAIRAHRAKAAGAGRETPPEGFMQTSHP
ncbi:MAG: class I SAM-dependent methyltransferase [Armatimonadota bacterium]